MGDNNNKQSRRNFLRLAAGTAAATAALCATGPAAALTASDPLRGTIKRTVRAAAPVEKTVSQAKPVERVLSFYNTHTHEELKIVYWANGDYVKPSLAKLDLLLRDHRQNEAVVMDPKLFDQLWDLQQRLGSDGVYEIISGYRSPATNNMLRKKSGGVASKSYHLQGRAIDIRLRGSKTSDVRTAALDMQAGGVGYYPGSDFVHLDTGPVRNWS